MDKLTLNDIIEPNTGSSISLSAFISKLKSKVDKREGSILLKQFKDSHELILPNYKFVGENDNSKKQIDINEIQDTVSSYITSPRSTCSSQEVYKQEIKKLRETIEYQKIQNFKLSEIIDDLQNKKNLAEQGQEIRAQQLIDAIDEIEKLRAEKEIWEQEEMLGPQL